MHDDQKLLEALLVPHGYIEKDAFLNAVREAERKGATVSTELIARGLIKDEQLGQLIAEEYGFSFVDLRNTDIDEKVFHLVPELVCRTQGVVAFEHTVEGYNVGMLDPRDLAMRHALEKRLGAPVHVFLITREGLAYALGRFRTRLSDEITRLLESLKNTDLSRTERDDLTIALVDTLLSYGHFNRASDIHIEPYESTLAVRFRIDGVMHDVAVLPKEFAELILTRIKILARMRTDEHRAAQDGKLRFHPLAAVPGAAAGQEGASEKKDEDTGGGDEALESEKLVPADASVPIDVRVSIVPVTLGENVVMRLLSSESRQYGLQDLGLVGGDLEKMQRAMEKPHGMILVTGPTGSGKTTTLYAAIKVLNRREVHISTIEDPVEYDIEGLSQIQVNSRTNLTFADGLRAIVRQDPDIIFVGEIRDSETAGIAVNSAMTGHLVLSTMHANDAATTLPRLLDMGIEPFLVASTVNLVVAQRLVRTICESCRASVEPTEAELSLINKEPSLLEIFRKKGYLNAKKSTKKSHLLFYKGSGCSVCGGSGYRGRIGIFESLELTNAVKDLVVDRAPSNDIMEAARAEGMTTMLDDGVDKVLAGVTSLEEVLRVTKM